MSSGFGRFGRFGRFGPHIVVDNLFATCSLCQDAAGKPTRMDRKSLKRHLTSSRHTTNQAQVKKNRRSTTKVSLSHQTETPIASEPCDQTNNWQSSYVDPSFLQLPSVSPDSSAANSLEDSIHLDDANARQTNFVSVDLFAESQTVDQTLSADRPQWQPHTGDDQSDSDSDSDSSDWETVNGDEVGPVRNTWQLPSIGQGLKGVWPDTPTPSSQSNPWFPYPSKAMFLADLLYNSRRTHFTRRQFRAVLEFARQCEGSTVPSFAALKKFQASLKSRLGNPTKRVVSSGGTVYYVNQVSESLRQDMANPNVRKHMNFYPHVDGKHMSQAWHGHKMVHDIPDRFLTPCACINGRMFYVNELVRRQQDWFIPLRWITHGPSREMCAIGHIVKDTELGLSVLSDKRITVKASTFLESFPEIQARGAVPAFTAESRHFASNMPHTLRTIAGSRPVYSVPLIGFMDDASGGQSKLWNKHWVCYLSNAALPREELQAEYNVRFVATSPHATPSELMCGIRESIEDGFNNPTVAFDSETGEEILIRPFSLFWAGDNPMQAEHCSSHGLNSSHFCRTCDVGGTEEFKRSLVGYQSLFKPGNLRVAGDTRRLIEERLEMATKPKMIQRIKDRARDTGIKDSLAQPVIDRLLDLGKSLQKPAPGVTQRTAAEIEGILLKELEDAKQKGCLNPLLDMEGVDIHRDTPTEILHTVLLGVVKYYWAQSVFVIERAKRLSLLESRLASVNQRGLDLPNITAQYICQYRGSLIGKHFKALVQVMPFISYDLLTPELFDAWVLLGRMTNLLWYTEIDNISLYLEELRLLIDDFLLATARCSPSIMILKPKFHFLIHLPLYIRRFGPALLFSTERFESFNGVFRAASVFSNRQAPSRDIARRFAELDRVRHISSGGYWREGRNWVRASNMLLNFLSQNELFSKIVGMPHRVSRIPGSISPLSRSTISRNSSGPRTWQQFARDGSVFGDTPPGQDDDRYVRVSSVVSQSGETVGAGQDILYQRDSFGHTTAILECIHPDGQSNYFAAIETYVLGSEKHPKFDMPTATRSGLIVCIPVEEVICLVNMQHDCSKNLLCTNTKPIREVQEREETTRVRYLVEHCDAMHFIINIHSIHNALHLRRALPPHLYARRPLSANVQQVFTSAIEKMSSSKQEKDKVAAAKREARAIIAGALKASESGAAGVQREGDDDEAGAVVSGRQVMSRT